MVRTNPPCSLANLFLTRLVTVQGTIIQPCSGIVTDGIQAIMQLLQGVVTYTSPVEAFCDRDQEPIMLKTMPA